MNFFTLNSGEQEQKIGEKIGTSDWILMTQNMSDQFGNVTLDLDPMHVDPEWSSQHSPYHGTVAFGFQTISMLTSLLHNVIPYDKFGNVSTGGYPLNYGFDRLRLTGPVPVGSRIRGHFTLKDMRGHGAGEVINTVYVEVEVEGVEKPALVAEWLFIWITEEGHSRIAKDATSG